MCHSSYSKADRVEFAQFRKIIDQATSERERWVAYKDVRRTLNNNLGDRRRNVERYIVDYVKSTIKSPIMPAEKKFRSLLLLKDLMDNRHKQLVDYTDKKLMKRLFVLAKSPLKENVLTMYDKSADLKYSKNFYTLLLECLDNWGLKYGATNPSYLTKRKSLVTMRLLPIAPNFYNVPGTDEDLVLDSPQLYDELSLGKLNRCEG